MQESVKPEEEETKFKEFKKLKKEIQEKKKEEEKRKTCDKALLSIIVDFLNAVGKVMRGGWLTPK